jgi:predicted AlkP superfamily phosphohydrolase/phosphomutase
MVSRHTNDSRVFVIALDGATFDVIKPWMQAGDLPNLQGLVQSGVHGALESTYPPLTGPAWGSFMTGKTPANHGVLEFFRRAANGYNQFLNSREDFDGRSIWRVLSDAGKKVGVLSVPATYPPEAVNGFMVTGLLTPRQPDVTFTYPLELGEELDEKLGGYLLQHTEKYLQDDPTRLIREEQAILNNRVDAALYLMQNKSWDFFILHILGTDVMQHGFWHFMDPTHPQYDPKLRARYGSPIFDFWKQVDKRLGDVLAKLPPDAYVMVMSDHGFGPVVKYVNFNVWLLRTGFLQLKRDVWSRLRYLAFRLGYNYAMAFRVGFRLGIVRQVIRLGRGKQKSLQREVFLSLDDVDWRRTQVYSVGNFGQMYVNLKGREPQGCVSPGDDYERVLQRLEDALRAMRAPETNEPVIAEIWRGSDLFKGKYVDRAPDLFFFTRDMKYKAMGLTDFGSNRVFDDLYGTHAHHRMNGLFILRGPGVRQGEQIQGARLIDLAPTIYSLMGVPIPQDLDGQPLHRVFVPSYEITPHYESGPVDYFVKPDAEQVYSPEEEAAVAEQLRNLGYVE